MSELWRLTAAEAGRQIAAGEITSEALVRSCLERIEDRDPDVEAWTHLDPDYALAGAREADSSPAKSPLHGVPFAVKDVIDSGELPTEYGAPAIHGGHRPERDAACVAAMRSAGAVLMGKTVSTEFATFWPGKTKNPHNPGHTPGGSSSGSAAAVGASMVPVAFGNQTAGSLIRPAAFCGAAGFKPTHGTVDLTGILPLEPTFDTLGYMARSVDDLGLFYDIVRGADPEAPADGLGRAPRVGLCRTHHWQKADAVCREAVERAAAKFSDLGADVADVDLPDDFATIPDSHRVILNAGLTQSLARQYADHRDRLSDRLRGMIEEGLGYDEATLGAARAQARACRAAAGDAFGDRDVLLTPSAPGEAPEGLGMTGDPIFQTTWTLLHLPCVTLPFATGPRGLPIGVQLIGSRGEDAAALAVAKWFHGRM